jgi:hypothetical protein
MTKELSNEEMIKIVEKASKEFSGLLPELESASGMLFMGKLFGWKVLYIVHSKSTVRKYEEILDIKVRECFKDEGPLAKKSIGLMIAKKLSNFWKAISENINGVRNAELV